MALRRKLLSRRTFRNTLREILARNRYLPFMEMLEECWVLAIFLVTNDNDSGVESLRQAIFDANGLVGADTINFNKRFLNVVRCCGRWPGATRCHDNGDNANLDRVITLRIELMLAKARCDQTATAAEHADWLIERAEKLVGESGNNDGKAGGFQANRLFLQAAAAYGIAADFLPAPEQQALISKAMKAMKRSLETGFKDASHLRQDPDLAPGASLRLRSNCQPWAIARRLMNNPI